MPRRALLAICILASSSAWPFQAAPAPPAAPSAISLADLTPADQRIIPMPLADRQRLHAVPARGMCSTIPAKRAPDGLISGNGKMYVEVYGDPFAEQVIFHHERLIAPWKGDPLAAPEIASVLPEVRRLILAGEYRKANELSLAKVAEGPTHAETANLREHPAHTMRIDDAAPQHAVRDYLRTIDFETGEVKIRWTDHAGAWQRRTFVSRPDNLVVQLLTAPAGASIHATLTLDTSAVLRHAPSAAPRTIAGRAGMPQPLHDPGAEEVRFTQAVDPHHITLEGRYVVDHGQPGYASATRILANGGSVTPKGDSLVVAGAHSLTLITRIEAYDDLTQPAVDALKTAVDQIPPDYNALFARHRPGQAAVLDRTSMDFGGAPFHAMSGEEMLADQRTRLGYNPALLENLYDMGRYWLYLRSGDFPPIWGHVNINVNLQQAPAVMGDLPEATMSYAHWVEGLLPDSRVNAKNIFGARGALFAIHPTQRGGQLDHFAYGWPHQYWISAGGWMYSPLWDYYLATGDKHFLSDHILPGLEEIGLFYEDYLSQTDKQGKYIFVPSYSPENWPSNSESSPAVINADMDIMVCREVFNHLIEASQTLGVNADQIPRWQAILAKLPPYLIDPDGALKEWAWPTLEEGVSLDHRHESHLYGVWPGDEITPDTTPTLARAAWLAARERAQGNASAHGMLHRALAATRLKDPYLVNFDLKELLEQGYVNPSLTTLHNPYSYPAPDPQGGIPTILMEMLVYSRPGVIGLLPALPVTLTHGAVKGILARTGVRVDSLTWDMGDTGDTDTNSAKFSGQVSGQVAGQVAGQGASQVAGQVTVTLSSRTDQTIHLSAGSGLVTIDSAEGASLPKQPPSKQIDLPLSAAHPVTLHLTLGKQNPSPYSHRPAE